MSSGHGGRREGSGRPCGATSQAGKYRAYAKEKGLEPVEFLIDIYNDPEQDIRVRVDCAKAASGYTASKLRHVGVDANTPIPSSPEQITNQELILAVLNKYSQEELMELLAQAAKRRRA